MTRIHTLVAIVLALGLAVVTAGCGRTSERPPSPASLVLDSARALEAEKPVRFAFDVKARVQELVPAKGAEPDPREFGASASLACSTRTAC